MNRVLNYCKTRGYDYFTLLHIADYSVARAALRRLSPRLAAALVAARPKAAAKAAAAAADSELAGGRRGG
jgi:hypothetical protein